jgi:hypothetical protein
MCCCCCHLSPPAGLPKVAAYVAALKAHPPVVASCAPPEGSSGSYEEQLVDTYREYVAARKAAAK